MDVRVWVAVAVAVEVVEAWLRERGWWGNGGGILERVVPAWRTRDRRVDGRVCVDVMDRDIAGLS